MTELGPLVGVGRTAEVFAFGPGRVIKLLRPGFPAAFAEAEAQVALLVADAYPGAPACDGMVTIAGRSGIVYERVAGPTMDLRVRQRPWQVDRLAGRLGRLHAAMHAAAGTGLRDQRAGLHAAVDRASAWLRASAAAAAYARIELLPTGSSLCHGDLHPANVLLGSRDVVIDWDNATSGSPAADVARSVFLIRDAAMLESPSGGMRLAVAVIRRRFCRTYLAAYRASRPLDPAELHAWRLPILAARLAEAIEEERAGLLAEIDREIATGPERMARPPIAGPQAR